MGPATARRRIVATEISPKKSGLAHHLFRLGEHRRRSSTPVRLFPSQSTHSTSTRLLFYPWRAVYVLKTASKCLCLARRYRRIMARVMADASSVTYSDDALRLDTAQGEPDRFIEMFVGKTPFTHGAQVGVAASVATAGALRVSSAHAPLVSFVSTPRSECSTLPPRLIDWTSHQFSRRQDCRASQSRPPMRQ